MTFSFFKEYAAERQLDDWVLRNTGLKPMSDRPIGPKTTFFLGKCLISGYGARHA